MFKTSFQRHARLGNVARRQILTLSPLRGLRIQTLGQQPCRRTALPVYNQSIAAKTLSRFYSSEAVAERQDAQAELQNDGHVTRFADLSQLGVHPKLVSSITEGMGYQDMTEVQSMTINAALNGVDLVAQAKTGTGKTLAFLVPIFQRILMNKPELADGSSRYKASSEDIQAIILSPTRELAEQIGVEAHKLAKYTGIKVQTAVGGTRKREALAKMQYQGCHILVATPGRLNDLLSDSYARVSAPNLKAFVMDEADRMLDAGFSDAIREILSMLPAVKDVDRQTLLFSATIPKDVVHLAKSLVRTDNFEFVQTIRRDEEPTHARIPQHVVPCHGYENWFPSILEIAHKYRQSQNDDPSLPPFKAIIFFSNTATVELAAQTFENVDVDRMPRFHIHSGLNQAQRTRASEAFRRVTSGFLFSSDVTARGMDFPGVTHVIQVGLPPDRDQYIHRLGRTGRAGKEGEGWLLLAQEEIAEARMRLAGLPLKANHSLVAASFDMSKSEASSKECQKYISDISRGYQNVNRPTFVSAYNGLLGQKAGRNLRPNDIVILLNNWVQHGLRWDEPIKITPKKAANLSLARGSGIAIGYEDTDPLFSGRGGGFGSRDSGRSGSRDSGGFGSRGGGFGGSRRGGDNSYGGNSFGGDRGRGRNDFGRRY